MKKSNKHLAQIDYNPWCKTYHLFFPLLQYALACCQRSFMSLVCNATPKSNHFGKSFSYNIVIWSTFKVCFLNMQAWLHLVKHTPCSFLQTKGDFQYVVKGDNDNTKNVHLCKSWRQKPFNLVHEGYVNYSYKNINSYKLNTSFKNQQITLL